MADYLRNDPGFDPTSSGRRVSGGKRGRRAIWFMLIALFGGGALFIAATKWIFSRGDHAEAAVHAEDPRISPPAMNMEAQVEPPPEVVEEPPPPPPPPPARERAKRGRPSGSNGAGPKLPSQIAWNVQVAGEVPDDSWFANAQRPHLAHGCALRPGASQIPAVLTSVVQSEVPGAVYARASSNVYDPDNVGNLLIPEGTNFVGEYKSDLTLGSRRLGIVWKEATYPNGEQIVLADANGLDVAGSMGVGGEVTTSWGQVIATVAVFSILDAGQRQTAPDDTWAGQLGDSAATQSSRVSTQIIKKMLDQAVKIRIPAGTQVTITPGKTLQLC
jgi:type IV secretory pathway VirB10-like protein